jgi:hypothetical protein
VEAVGRELSHSVDELTSAAMNDKQNDVSRLISEIVRHALITHVKSSMNDIGQDVVDSFSSKLMALDTSMSDFSTSEGWLEKITESTKNVLLGAKNGLEDIVNERKGRSPLDPRNQDKMYKVVTTILAMTTTVLNPILELVIIFLPELLGGLLDGYQKRKQEEQIRNNIMTQIIPSLKRELRSKLPEIFNQQIQDMIKSIGARFESVLEEKQQTIEAAQREMDNKSIDIQKQITLYKDTASRIATIVNTALYKKETK